MALFVTIKNDGNAFGGGEETRTENARFCPIRRFMPRAKWPPRIFVICKKKKHVPKDNCGALKSASVITFAIKIRERLKYVPTVLLIKPYRHVSAQ